MRLGGFRALSFDCYGTLIDWEAGLTEALRPLRAGTGSAPPVEQALADFAAHEAEIQAGSPGLAYPDVLAAVFARLATQWNAAATPEDCARFGRSIGDWPAFPDSADALRTLNRHVRLFILSNVDRASFAASNAKLGVTFDGVFTAEDIGSYKPDVRNFEYLLAQVGEHGIARHELLHVAQSRFHDHAPANQLGIASAWIDRRGGRPGGATAAAAQDVHYDFKFASLADLVRALSDS